MSKIPMRDLLNDSHGAANGIRGKARTRRLLFCIALLPVLFLACGRHKSNERRYELKGKVVAVDQDLRKVTVDHQAIPGYMDAMTMPYVLKDDWAYGVLKPGDMINATLVVDGFHSWLQDVVISEESPDPAGAGPNGAAEPKTGDEIPAFSLVNQDGVAIDTKAYHGKILVMTFVYTRCPLPDYCPLMSLNLVAVEKELQKDPATYAKVHLLTVTIDPEYDTAAVMRTYGSTYTTDSGSDFQHWEFATGSQEQVKKIAEFFGLRFWKDQGQIVHSLRTAVIGSDGKLLKLYRGNDWKPADVLADLKAATP
ncbi:MAG TPA: SCO family protein [Blastocatellia bacterium]|nr:SCO family protein [Blastocatellia bacterium]